MKKCYIIMAHKVTKSLLWTVEYFSSFEENTIIIHYDKKSDVSQLVFKIGEAKNVHVLPERLDIVWGGFSQVDATLLLLKYSIKFQFEYIFFISGEDIPAMSNSAINTFLELNSGVEYIHYQDERNNFVDPYKRVSINYPKFYFNKNPNFLTKVLKKLAIPYLTIFSKNPYIKTLRKHHVLDVYYKGTNWFTLTRDSILWLLEYIDKNPILLLSFKKSIFIDEVFFHSILAKNGKAIIFNDKSKVNNALRYTDWTSGPQYPKLLVADDINKIQRGQVFFARKLDDENVTEKEFEEFKKLVN